MKNIKTDKEILKEYHIEHTHIKNIYLPDLIEKKNRTSKDIQLRFKSIHLQNDHMTIMHISPKKLLKKDDIFQKRVETYHKLKRNLKDTHSRSKFLKTEIKRLRNILCLNSMKLYHINNTSISNTTS